MIAIRKPGKPLDERFSHWSISLLCCCYKLLECLLMTILAPRRCPGSVGKTSYLLGQFFVRQILYLRHRIFFKVKNKIHKFVKALFIVFP